MNASPIRTTTAPDGLVAVVHARRLIAETLVIALRGIGVDATLDLGPRVDYALVDTSDPATIERLCTDGISVLAFGSADPISVARALRAGAAWHIGDEASFVDVADHVCRLAAGERLPAPTSTTMPEPNELDTLTRRETEILRSLVTGRRAAEIAELDFVSITTVRNQIQSVLTKLGAHSQLEAVAIAVRAGWTPLAA